MGKRDKWHLVKPFIHIGCALVVAAVVLVLYACGALSASTPVPSVSIWLLHHLLSIWGVIVAVAVAVVLAALHGYFKRWLNHRALVRKLFFYSAAFVAGKFYTWSGILFAFFIITAVMHIGSPQPWFLVYALVSFLVGAGSWVIAREIPFITRQKVVALARFVCRRS